jgi:hypothetical protein
MAARKTATKRQGSKGSGSRSSRGAGSKGSRSPARKEQGAGNGKPMGREPSHDPDVYVNIPQVHVGEITVDVERLEAHLALRAQVANLVNLVAGVHVGVDKVKIDLKDVDAEAMLKVRLDNTYNILDRTLTTLDENPEIVQKLLETTEGAVEQTGQIGRQATKPGGAVSELTSGVGDTLGNLGDSLGDTARSATEKAKEAAPNGSPGKGAAAAGAAGVAGLLGAALYRAKRRPRLLGIPIGKRNGGLRSLAKQIGGARKELGRARKTADKALG